MSIRNVVGLLALAVSLALASPGVNVVRADTEQAAAGAECQTGEAEPEPAADAFVNQLRRDPHGAVIEKRLEPRDEDWVVLNTRGYNYGPENTRPSPPPEDAKRP